MMYKIKAPSEEYDRKIGGVQFVSGEAQTDNEWLAILVAGGQCRRRALLVLVRFRFPCGVVCLLRELVCQRVRIY